MKNYLDGGEAILEAFRRLKIDYIMSSPGSEWSPVWEALARQSIEKKQGPAFIESWHETVAVDMALGYTLMTGKLQAVLLHSGVGVLQGSMAIHAALQMDVPMVVLSGESQSLGEDPELEIEQQWYTGLSVGGIERFIEPVTKWARAVPSPHTLYESVIRAGEMAQRIPRGPVYLNVALEHMLHPWTPPANPREVPAAPIMQPAAHELEAVAELLRKSKNPIIVAETAGRDPNAFAALVGLAEHLAIPVINGRANSYANFPTDHPLYLGLANYQAVENADLVLLVGGRAPWYPARRRPTAGKIVAIDDSPHKAHMIYQTLHADHYLEGNIAETLKLLTAAIKLPANGAAIRTRRERVEREHKAYAAKLRAEREKARNGSGIAPLALVDALAATMPPETIYVDETITHSNILREHLPQTMPHSFFRGSGGLGQGIGTALGIKLAAPERPVVLLVGDGSFLYNPIIQALGASKRHKLPIVIVVLNNRNYEAMRKGHVHHYPEGASVSHKLYYGVHIDGPEYAELGSHFGFPGERVEKVADLQKAIKKAAAAVKAGDSAILDVRVSR